MTRSLWIRLTPIPLDGEAAWPPGPLFGPSDGTLPVREASSTVLQNRMDEAERVREEGERALRHYNRSIHALQTGAFDGLSLKRRIELIRHLHQQRAQVKAAIGPS